MKLNKQSSGFTIIELLMGVLASAIIALAAGSLLYFTWVGWRNARESVALHRDASVAMRIIEHRIRNAGSGEVGGLGSGTITFASEQDYESGDIAPDNNIELQSFNVRSNDYGGVVVAFELETSRGADNGHYEMTIYPRN
jgi:Tfp pilus assembly protein PilW